MGGKILALDIYKKSNKKYESYPDYIRIYVKNDGNIILNELINKYKSIKLDIKHNISFDEVFEFKGIYGIHLIINEDGSLALKLSNNSLNRIRIRYKFDDKIEELNINDLYQLKNFYGNKINNISSIIDTFEGRIIEFMEVDGQDIIWLLLNRRKGTI